MKTMGWVCLQTQHSQSQHDLHFHVYFCQTPNFNMLRLCGTQSCCLQHGQSHQLKLFSCNTWAEFHNLNLGASFSPHHCTLQPTWTRSLTQHPCSVFPFLTKWLCQSQRQNYPSDTVKVHTLALPNLQFSLQGSKISRLASVGVGFRCTYTKQPVCCSCWPDWSRHHATCRSRKEPHLTMCSRSTRDNRRRSTCTHRVESLMYCSSHRTHLQKEKMQRNSESAIKPGVFFLFQSTLVSCVCLVHKCLCEVNASPIKLRWGSLRWFVQIWKSHFVLFRKCSHFLKSWGSPSIFGIILTTATCSCQKLKSDTALVHSTNI